MKLLAATCGLQARGPASKKMRHLLLRLGMFQVLMARGLLTDQHGKGPESCQGA